MKRILNLFKKNLTYQYLILFMLILFMHHKMGIFNDDLYFIRGSHNEDWFKLLSIRYQTWSSRILIEFFILIFVTLPMWIWKVVNSATIVLAIYSVNRVFSKRELRYNIWFVAGLFSMYPWFHMATAGWITTSVNYLWPASFFLYSLIYIRKLFNKEAISLTECVSYHLAFFFSNNHEHIVFMSFLLYCLYVSYAAWNNDISKFKYIISYIVISVINLLFILLAPGNKLRYLQEINRHFPNFNDLSVIDKFSIGLSTTLTHFVSLPNMLFAFMIVMVCLVLYARRESFEFKAKICWIIPLSLLIYNVYGVLNAIKVKPGSKLFVTLNRLYGIKSLSGVSNINHFALYTESLWLLLFFVLIGYLIYAATESQKDRLVIFTVLSLGFASRIILGFSPTIYASSFRTFIFAYVALIITILILYNTLQKSLAESKIRMFNRFIMFLIITGYTTNLAFVFVINHLKGA